MPDGAYREIALSVAIVSLASLAIAPAVGAQSRGPGRRHASFTVGASLGDGETALALTAGLGFQFSSRLALEVGLAYARKLDFTLEHCPPPRVCVRGGQLPVTGRTVSLVPHLAVDLLPRLRRIRVYAQIGIGAGHVRQRYFLSTPPTGSVAERVEFTRSSLTVALSYGGSVTTQISRRLAVGADVRSLHLFDERAKVDRFITPSGTLSTVRVGSRVSWQF